MRRPVLPFQVVRLDGLVMKSRPPVLNHGGGGVTTWFITVISSF
jgi:hypothetical protein